MMYGLEEVKRFRLSTGRIGKLYAVLANEWTCFELLEQSHPLKSPVRIGHQRFADVMPRKRLLLKEHNLAAFAGQDTSDGAAGRAAAHYNDVVIINAGFHA